MFNSKNAGSLKEVLNKYKSGTLKEILGKDTEASLQEFANTLVDLGDVGKEGSIAAGSVWANFFKHPINTLTTLGRAKVIAGAISTPQAAKTFLKARRAAGDDPRAQAQAMLGAINQSMVDEGMDVGGAASKAGKIIGGTFRNVARTNRAIRQTLPRGVGLGSFQQAEKPQIDIQPQAGTSLSNIDMFSPKTTPTRPSAPLSPIQQIRQSSIRKLAARDPSVAASLLGGLGSASLLNR